MPSAKPDSTHRPTAAHQSAPLEVVDPEWLLKAVGLSLVAALICAYATLCLLFYQGRWQLVLHPSAVIDRTPTSVGLDYSDVSFDASETGQPRLRGWWIPAVAHTGFGTRYAAYTVLLLHDGAGSLSATVPMLTRLHSSGLNIFAIDYRGYGASDTSVHPTEDRMAQDAGTALEYLASTRHIPTRNVIPYGVGLGASLAISLALAHSELPVVILDNPDPDPAATAVATHPSRLVPVRLLFGNGFDIATPLATLTTPKLLIAGGPNSAKIPYTGRLNTLFRYAASPSLAVTLQPTTDDSQYQASLGRFLDQYLPTS